jgi:hypothetical protein
MIDPRDARGKRAIEFQIQCAQEHRQLVDVRIKPDVSLTLLHHLKIWPVDRLKGDMFHTTRRGQAIWNPTDGKSLARL